jgi:hypothetical protein
MLNLKPYAMNAKPYTPNPKPYTMDAKPFTLHPPLTVPQQAPCLVRPATCHVANGVPTTTQDQHRDLEAFRVQGSGFRV